MPQSYADKDHRYFQNARTEIAPLLRGNAKKVLEIGCGAGATLHWLKSTDRCESAYGIELFHEPARTARHYADHVEVGDAEHLIDASFPEIAFDLILCLDVVEHMVDPWAFVSKLHRRMAPGGTVILSIPNVRHVSVIVPLVLLGRWRYREDGILDRTHLRFFTRESAFALAATPPLSIDRWLQSMPAASSTIGILNRLTLGLFKDFFAVQFIIASRFDSATAHAKHPFFSDT